MNEVRHRFRAEIARACIIVTTALLLAACAGTYSPLPLSDPTKFSSYQSKTIGKVALAVAILTDDEAASHFGVDLGKHDLQAMWISVRNASEWRYWLVRNIVDPDLYSADEAALVVRKEVADRDFERMRQHFRDESIPVSIDPGTTAQGYIFVPYSEGGRYIEVLLAADAYQVQLAERRLSEILLDSDAYAYQVRLTEDESAADAGPQLSANFKLLQFDFALTLPDGEFDYERLDTTKTYPGLQLPDLDLTELRRALEELPCCATNAEGDRNGDPLNVVIVSEANDLLAALSHSGWSFTHRITVKSVQRMVAAAMEGEGYAVAPVSSLYTFGRQQDIALQRARRNISQRNHMRLWLAPFRHAGHSVWVGQVSRDIGIKLTTHSPSLTTHVIDPAVDLTREYLLHSLVAQELVAKFGFVSGSTAATPEEPAQNLSGDPYFSDGLRVVLILPSNPVPYSQVRNLLWEQSAEPVAEGQTDTSQRNVSPIGTETSEND